MGLFSTSKRKLNWISITSIEELQDALDKSNDKLALFFKHSTRCIISGTVIKRFESGWNENDNYELYYIDLLAHRDVSNQLAKLTGVEHQSPQVIVVNKGNVIYSESHHSISAKSIGKLG